MRLSLRSRMRQNRSESCTISKDHFRSVFTAYLRGNSVISRKEYGENQVVEVPVLGKGIVDSPKKIT